MKVTFSSMSSKEINNIVATANDNISPGTAVTILLENIIGLHAVQLRKN